MRATAAGLLPTPAGCGLTTFSPPVSLARSFTELLFYEILSLGKCPLEPITTQIVDHTPATNGTKNRAWSTRPTTWPRPAIQEQKQQSMQMSSGARPCTKEVSPPSTTPCVLSRTSLCAVPVHDPAQASVREAPVGGHCASRTAATAYDRFAGLARRRLLRSHVRLAHWARPRLHDPIVQENPVEVMLARGLHDKSAALKAYITACLADALLGASGSDNNGTQIFVLLHIRKELE